MSDNLEFRAVSINKRLTLGLYWGLAFIVPSIYFVATDNAFSPVLSNIILFMLFVLISHSSRYAGFLCFDPGKYKFRSAFAFKVAINALFIYFALFYLYITFFGTDLIAQFKTTIIDALQQSQLSPKQVAAYEDMAVKADLYSPGMIVASQFFGHLIYVFFFIIIDNILSRLFNARQLRSLQSKMNKKKHMQNS